MDISLDDEIKKDKERDRMNRSRHHEQERAGQGRPRHNNDRYIPRSHHHHSHHQQQHREHKHIVQISNLHYSVDREQLQEICDKLGRVKNCRIEWDKTGRSNQRATIEYFSKQDAQQAAQKLNGMQIEEQSIKAELVEEEDRMPQKRHNIKKNYGNRYKHNNGNFDRYKGPN